MYWQKIYLHFTCVLSSPETKNYEIINLTEKINELVQNTDCKHASCLLISARSTVRFRSKQQSYMTLKLCDFIKKENNLPIGALEARLWTSLA